MTAAATVGGSGPAGAQAGPHPATGRPVDLRGIGQVSTAVLAQALREPGTRTVRVTVDHEGRLTGTPPTSDPTARQANPKLRRWTTLRDRTCRWPGCHQTAHTCDLNHLVMRARGGQTLAHLLWALCSTHHHGGRHAPGTTLTGRTDEQVTIHLGDGTTLISRPPPIAPSHIWPDR